MRGLLELSPFGGLVAALQARGDIVTTWSWMNWQAVVADAAAHRGDRIIVGGHSMGNQMAFAAGSQLKASGINVRVVGLDPLCTSPRVTVRGLDAVNIWGNGCAGDALPPSLALATSTCPAPPTFFYPADPRVQAAFIRYAR